MHSSRMRTAHSLTIVGGACPGGVPAWGVGGACLGAGGYLPREGVPAQVPAQGGGCLPRGGGGYLPRGVPAKGGGVM